MVIKQKDGYIEVKADKGKVLQYDNNIFYGGAFPLSFDTNQLNEIDEPEKDEKEEEDEQ